MKVLDLQVGGGGYRTCPDPVLDNWPEENPLQHEGNQPGVLFPTLGISLSRCVSFPLLVAYSVVLLVEWSGGCSMEKGAGMLMMVRSKFEMGMAHLA